MRELTNAAKPFGEVVESSLSIFKAQCWKWDTLPSFGSLVTVPFKERTLFGIVYDIQTGSLDGNRTVFAYQKTEQELMQEQPQIFEFLCTTFSCLIAGYTENNTLLYQLAPEPPKMHTFVYPASDDYRASFFSSEQYLPLLFSFAHHIFSLDELLLALLKQASDTHMLTQEALSRFIEIFSLLTANDYRRLKLFLQRAQPLIKLSKHTMSV
jgi:hypothetical protein